MGYTHYWSCSEWDSNDEDGLRRALPYIECILERHKDILCREYDRVTEPPEISEKQVVFNGKGEDGHETFAFEAGKNNFCKTARKPYDLPVCEVLLVLKACIPHFHFSSDGFCGLLTEQEEKVTFDGSWDKAIRNVQEYDLYYEGTITKRREPYCDIEPILSSASDIGPKADTETTAAKSEKRKTRGEEHVFCGICGQKGTQLLTHIRKQHSITPEEYTSRCPGAPLFSPAFGRYVVENNLRMEAGSMLQDVQMFGLSITCPVKPVDNAPDLDQQYRFDESVAKPLLQSLLDNDRILIVGHTGCGKSSLVSQLAARTNRSLVRVNLHGETGVSDFVGQWTVKGKEMTYQYGILPTAMREGRILVLEELDAADPGILFVLQNVLEEDGNLILTDKGGEVITPHPDFRLVATANTLGLGDETGLYTGTNVLNGSHLDRWTTVFEMGYLSEHDELELITTKTPGLERRTAEQLVSLAHAVRKAATEEQVYCTFSTRRLLVLCRKFMSYNDISAALKVTVLNRLAPNDRQVVAELAQRHIGG